MYAALDTQHTALASTLPQNYYGNIFEGFSRLPQSIQLWIKTMDEMNDRKNGLIKYFKESDPRSAEGQRKKKEHDREYFWLIFLMAIAFSEQENQVLIAIQQIRNRIKQRVEAIDMKINMTQHIIDDHAQSPEEKKTLLGFVAKLREMRHSYIKYQKEELNQLQQRIVQARNAGTPLSPDTLETYQNQLEERFEQMDSQMQEENQHYHRSGFRLSDLWGGHSFFSQHSEVKVGNDNKANNIDVEKDKEPEGLMREKERLNQKDESEPYGYDKNNKLELS